MKVLFDHCTPRPLRRYFVGHPVSTARELGWDRLRNGRLLETAEAAGFELLLSADQSLRYQQNLAGRKIALLVLTSPLWPRVEPHAQRIVEVALAMQPSTHAEFVIP